MKYKLIIYHMGNPIDEMETDDLDEARIYYRANSCENVAVILYIDGKRHSISDTYTMFISSREREW